MIYLDHAATTAAYPEVVSEMTPYLDRQYFNPSGSYREGRLLHKKLDKIREKLAAVIHASPEEIIFTSVEFRLIGRGLLRVVLQQVYW